ncbi:urease accessory protein UreD [Bacillus sp. S/N-304-OC-R1]|uniref:urease accessory protein UreD n=1 Tax=Bacillus sp. S/N-304-OC-R1 TaxID=2758034 RepID=UPI001C8EF880|nr:urease accessory protein UreD [Bacillus sp. S/N-304-OC-R1]MBY0120398.1 urease accessory protein UreD [Bacillus sp. S/N-304-OC-R1]
MSNWTGVLKLDAEDRGGRTVARNVYFQGALKLMRPIYHDDSGKVCYYLLNPGGGYLDGDRYRLHISLNERARVTLTTQSATKIYKTPNSLAYQETEIHLKEGSFLEYLPDPLIAYRNAKYKQKNVIRMEKGATLIYSDIITPGWSPDGEFFSYEQLQLINEIYMDEELITFDHLKLSPSVKNMKTIGIMEGYTHIGSMIVICDQTNNELLDRIYKAVKSEENEYKIGLSLLPVPGFSIRILANLTQTIERIFNECHKLISEEWFQTSPSFLRKY